MDQYIEAIEKFISIVHSAKTRSGVPFIWESFFLGGNDKVTLVKGKVFLEEAANSIQIPFEMHWDLKGTALILGSRYDLIIEDPF